MAKHHIPRVARIFEGVFNNADQFPTPTKSYIKAYENTHLPQNEDKRTVKIFT